jgi:regulator of sirC expression with transglutaminase-like and TPR domain
VAPYYNRGLARQDQGDIAGAIADYERVLELTNDPEVVQLIQKSLAELRP